jgi:hypothetical protein
MNFSPPFESFHYENEGGAWGIVRKSEHSIVEKLFSMHVDDYFYS